MANNPIQELLEMLLPVIPIEAKKSFVSELGFNYYIAFKHSGNPLRDHRGIRAFSTYGEADEYLHNLTFEDELIIRKCEDLF